MSTYMNQAPVQPGPQKKKPFYAKKGFLIAAGIVLLFIVIGIATGGGGKSTTPTVQATTEPASGAAGASAPAAAPAAPAVPGVGEAVTVNQGGGNVARITIVSAKYVPEAGQFMSTPKNGGYLVLDVLWETESGTTSANPLYFKAKDAAGRAGEYGLGADGQLGTGDVPAGDKSRGNVAFDVSNGPWTVSITDKLLQDKARINVAAQ